MLDRTATTSMTADCVVKVVNGTAERGVKLAKDYTTILTKDDKIRAMIMQGVEKNWSMYPDFKKTTLNN